MAVAEPDTSLAVASGPEATRLRVLAGGAVLVLLAVLAAGSALLVQRYEQRLYDRGRDIRDLRAGDAKNRQASRDAMILGLAKLADSRDSETGGHLERIRIFVRLLGTELIETHPEVDADFVEVLVEMCALHDIGKVGISDEVLHKPGPLTDEEREQIRRHPLIGGDTLLAVKRRWGDDEAFVTACEIVFAHHERWDGTGYPFGLKAEVIPISARIVSVADVYDALTSARVYKDALSHTRAAEIIRAGSGTQFDPDVVDAFNRAEESFRAYVDDPDREPSQGFV
jgi:putative two-component system response regulator